MKNQDQETQETQEIQASSNPKNKILALGLPVLFIPILALFFFLLGGGNSQGSADPNAKLETEEKTVVPASVVNMDIPQADSSALAHPGKLEAFEQSIADTARIRKERTLALNEVIYQFDEIALETELESAKGEEEAFTNSESEVINGRSRLYDAYEDYESYDDSPVYIARRGSEDNDRDDKQDSLINLLIDYRVKQQEIAGKNQAPEKEVKSIVTLPDEELKVVSSLVPSTPSADSKQTNTANRFYGLSNSTAHTNPTRISHSIAARVQGKQDVSNGSTVKLRLETDIAVNSVLIPAGSFIYGLASFSGERVEIRIESIQYQGNLFEVELAVYDLDGLEGIRAPQILTSSFQEELQASRDESLDSAEDGVDLGESLGGQIGNSVVKSSKKLFGGKKNKIVKVTLKAGYQVLLI